MMDVVIGRQRSLYGGQEGSNVKESDGMAIILRLNKNKRINT
jgi:hypothetical protein